MVEFSKKIFSTPELYPAPGFQPAINSMDIIMSSFFFVAKKKESCVKPQERL